MKHSSSALALVIALGLGVSGCGVLKKTQPKSQTVGERIPVLNFETKAEAEAELADMAVVLPIADVNPEWSQPGGSASKSNGHPALAETITLAWTASIGKGSTATRRLNASPVISGGRVFTMDTSGDIRAFDARTGQLVWQASITLPKRNSNAAFGGGVAVADGRVFATTGYGIAGAFDAATGKELWRESLGQPLRGAPSVYGNRVFALTIDNQLFALNVETGETMWNVSGTVEVAGLLGAAAPAVAQDTVVVGFSSGELNALRAENGRTVWADALARTGRSTAMAALSDIDASPVIDRGRVYAIGHGGRMATLELATGQRVWERNFAGTSTPWVVGEFVYIVTLEGEVLCLTRRDGKIRWVRQLDRYKNVKKKTDPIQWTGPILAGDRLFVVSSQKQMVSLSPYTGTVMTNVKLDAPAFLAPVVADSTLYLLDDKGKLSAWR